VAEGVKRGPEHTDVESPVHGIACGHAAVRRHRSAGRPLARSARRGRNLWTCSSTNSIDSTITITAVPEENQRHADRRRTGEQASHRP
jgi:hypothetical protein